MCFLVITLLTIGKQILFGNKQTNQSKLLEHRKKQKKKICRLSIEIQACKRLSFSLVAAVGHVVEGCLFFGF